MGCLYFFLSVCPGIAKSKPDGMIAFLYNTDWLVGYVFVANLIQSIVTLLLSKSSWVQFQV